MSIVFFSATTKLPRCIHISPIDRHHRVSARYFITVLLTRLCFNSTLATVTSKNSPKPSSPGSKPRAETLIYSCKPSSSHLHLALSIPLPPSNPPISLQLAHQISTIHSTNVPSIPETIARHSDVAPSSIPTIESPKVLEAYDAFLFGIPTRYGNQPAQWRTFWDGTAPQWTTAAYKGKYAGLFVSTATQGGGQESTAISMMSTFAHHGIIYVPLGYGEAFGILSDLQAPRGGSPWGAGTFAGPDGSRQPTENELQLATLQGKNFWEIVSKVDFTK